MIQRALGRSGLQASAIGLGCMGMSEFYGPTDEVENLRTLERALELGVDFLDTADMYGPYTNEQLLGRFLRGRRERVVLATKFGIVRGANPAARGVDNRPEHIRASIDGSLARLSTDHVDLYYAHRIDRSVPIEETVGVMADLVAAGKVRAIGLSEVSAATLRRAHAVHPIAAVQSEYSLFTRDPESNGVLAVCRELEVSFVAYSPLGRGLLTSTPPSEEVMAADDFRRRIPRFENHALVANNALADTLRAVALEIGATPAQVALAWLVGDRTNVLAIPGTRRIGRLEENAKAAELALSPELRARLDEGFPPGVARGGRSSAEGLLLLDA